MILQYTGEELERTLRELNALFDQARAVDPICTAERHENCPYAEGGADEKPNCYAVWSNRSERCLNCISLRALREGERQTKYEFIGSDIYYVIAIPVEADGRALVLEIINRVNDRALLNAYGVNEFVSRITAYNTQRHTDPTTGLFNRSFYEEKLFLLCSKAALNKTDVSVAMLDVDGYEHVVGHFGRQVADEAIVAIGRMLAANVSRRRGDFVARYGVNTFVLVLDNIPPLLLRERLVELTQRVTVLRLMGFEDIRLNVAMGVFQLSENSGASVEQITKTVEKRVEAARAAGFNRIAFSDR